MSIASRITSIENHIENAYDSLSYMGETATNKNIENIAGLVDNIYAKLPKVTNSTASSSVTLNPTLKGRIDSTLKGQIGQNTTEGRNVFNPQTSIFTVLGNTAQENLTTGKRIIYDGNTSAEYQAIAFPVIDLTNYVGATIRMKCTPNPSASNTALYYLGICESDGSNRTKKVEGSTGEISFVVPTLTGNQKYLCLALYANAAGTVNKNDYVDYTDLIITINNSDTTYEPYTGRNTFTKSKL